MSTQSEAELEERLIRQLVEQGYQRVAIGDQNGLIRNLKLQLEAHNATRFSDEEFGRILNHLSGSNVFDCAKILRDRYLLRRDDGKQVSIAFLNTHEWCKNRFQITNQITQKGRRVNRYDVTILINGLPLVHIELKRRGMEVLEAFNQVNRYHRESFSSGFGLFNYVQIFVISNGVNTKYYANQRKQSKMQTFFWADENNNRISCLSDFAKDFLEKCHIAKMISRHIVLHQSGKVLMVLRPYQVFAVEALVERVKNTNNNGYIWHTTGSGKTLTSFKTSQIIAEMADVEKVLFVVDRVDLDDQTMQEFDAYQRDAVDSSSDTKELVEHFANPNAKLIVTTIQKLNNAISRLRHDATMTAFKNKRVVLIFDECHRSQFGMTHQKILNYFSKAQLFGFTGTPILAENAVKGIKGIDDTSIIQRTTAELFGDCLHTYLINDGIADDNVLPFSIDYYGRLKSKNGELIDDEMVAGINRSEWYEGQDRIDNICDWIIANHSRKTHDQAFTSILAVGSIKAACTYYDTLKKLKLEGRHKLKIVTIFSAPANEEDPEADGHDPAEEPYDIEAPKAKSTHRMRLDEYIEDYNTMFGTSYKTQEQGGFYKYYRDISRRIKSHDKEDYKPEDRIDILLVVNMFLTGFDAKKVNTLYVDKNLQYHGLIQAFSRTNRIFNARKSHGQIVCFRNLKKKTDEAIKLFSNPNAEQNILLDSYESYVERFKRETLILFGLVPTPQAVDTLVDEVKQLEFIKFFRRMMRTMNTLLGFADFKWEDVTLSQQDYEDYKSKYLDLYDRVKRGQDSEEPASILQDIDFELELIHRDEINVHYILQLLTEALKEGTEDARHATKKRVLSMLGSESQLRSKRELIEKFITEYWDRIDARADIQKVFDDFWQKQRRDHLEKICAEEQLKINGVKALIGQYRFNKRYPLGNDIIELMETLPGISERRSRIDVVRDKIIKAIKIFEQ